ncbi:MAG: hypothetical protein JOZ19_11855 [Rubrobacter sp.]|nr:hypothetical protein [Rubrobacter sp.]
MPEVYTRKTLEEIPNELAERNQFVVWRWEKRNGKSTKVPYSSSSHKRADTTDPNTWGSFRTALRTVRRNPKHYAGLGFVFSIDDQFAAIDLDHCRDPETGAISEWAVEGLKAFRGAYIEISPSGTGLHIICRGHAPNRNNRRDGIEAYSSQRFFTLTGNTLRAAPKQLSNCQDAIDDLVRKYFQFTKEPTIPAPLATTVALEDKELLDKARGARSSKGEEFIALYDQGDISTFPSHSEARFALLRHLAFWTCWELERIARLYESSALYRMPGYHKKWARLWRTECQNAIAATPRAYRQEAKPATEEGGELAHIIAALKVQAARMAWEGRSGPTDRHVYDALLDMAARYGTPAKRGVIVSADVRTLALNAGTSRQTAMKSLHRLREDRDLIRLSRRSNGYKAAVYLLKYPAPAKLTTIPCVHYGQLYRNLRNRGPDPVHEYDKNGRKLPVGRRYLLSRLGKLPALILEKVAGSSGRGMSLTELAGALGRGAYDLARPRKVFGPDGPERPSGPIPKLLEAGLITQDACGLYHVPSDLEERLQIELAASGCDDARKRDADRYDDERYAFRHRDEHLPDDAPSVEDMGAKRRERVHLALEAFCREGSGPQIVLHTYLDGDTEFEYVVRSVAYSYRAPGSSKASELSLWQQAVEDACQLYIGEVSE